MIAICYIVNMEIRIKVNYRKIKIKKPLILKIIKIKIKNKIKIKKLLIQKHLNLILKNNQMMHNINKKCLKSLLMKTIKIINYNSLNKINKMKLHYLIELKNIILYIL